MAVTWSAFLHMWPRLRVSGLGVTFLNTPSLAARLQGPSAALSLSPYSLLAIFALYLALRLLSIEFTRSPFHHLPGPPPQSRLTGNLAQLFNAKGLPFHSMLSEVYGVVVRVYGFFGDEQLYVSDPGAIGVILGQDGGREGEGCFDETRVFLECNKVIFGPGLVSTTGELHRRQRKLALPMFSTAQLGRVRGVFFDIAEKLVHVLQNEITHSHQASNRQHEGGNEVKEGVLDMSEWSSRVSLEAAGRAILGYSFDPLDSRVANRYTSAIKELIPTLFSLALIRNFAPFLVKLGSPAFRRWVVERIPSRRVRKVIESSDVMDASAKEILAERRAAALLSESGTSRRQAGDEGIKGNGKPKDVISMLLRANDLASPSERMSDAELTGQMTVLIFGAQDTTSSALSRIFALLAENPEVQGKVREEIRRAYAEGCFVVIEGVGEGEKRLDADVIMKMSWLNAVIKETLRMYPPVPFVRRVCMNATTIPYIPSFTTPAGSLEKGELEMLQVPKGATLFLSIIGCNRNKEVWGEDAGVWRPGRWICEEDEKRKPYSDGVKIPGAWNGMLSFLGGGRSCVGSRFAMIEMKITLATVLSKMYFKPTDDEIVWNLSQIISPSVVRHPRPEESANGEEETKGLPLVAVLDDLTV